MNTSIAVLLTCYNRREKTLTCLESLYSCQMPENHILVVYLVDDGSHDGTSEVVKKYFPQVNVIQGTGNLFWNRGMRLAWEIATQINDYDFYLWLNDDTILDCNAIFQLIETYEEIIQNYNKPAVLCGACRATEKTSDFSYGGRIESGSVIPNGKIQSCKYINGNAVLVPKEIYHIIGYLSPEYTHSMGDFDYGLRILKENLNCYTTKTYIATCPQNEGIPAWCNPQTPIKKRWELLHSPKGLNIHEYIVFRKKFWGRKWIIYAIKAYLKTIYPNMYITIAKKNNAGSRLPYPL